MKTKRVMAGLLAALVLLLHTGSPRAARADDGGEQAVDYYQEMPIYLRVTQSMETEDVSRAARIRRTYPTSANAAVDAEIRALVDEMAERNRAKLPEGTREAPATLDVGAVISRTGTSFMSFLTLAEIACQREQLSVDFDARVYDMQTGERLALTDIFPQESEAWAMLTQAVRQQLGAAFPGEEPDADALDALCQPQAIQSAPFTLGAARLELVYRADAVYPGKQTLLHVAVRYADVRDLMNERAQAQTDNSRFRKVALTYDDGGALSDTRDVLDELRNYGADATFFVVGRMIGKNHYNLCRQQDAGYSVQTHTYRHKYPNETTDEEKWEDKALMAREIAAVTGVEPAMMRAPGGMEAAYLRLQIGYPLIHWSLASGDSGNDDVHRIAEHVIYNVEDGDIVLMHDINSRANKYTARILRSLTEQGFLLLTVEELFEDAGVELAPNRVYFSTRRVEDSARN